MIKKVLISIALLISVLIVAGYIFQDRLVLALVASQISPDHDFSAELAPPAPDYRDDSAWAALPSKTDPSDDQPDGVSDSPLGVSVFFVHPTSYLSKDGWNQPLTDEEANWVVDQRVLRHQASVFNGCCAVHAPRYRQATIFSFMDESGNGEAALDLAYQDVEAAFEQFIEQTAGRPFIVAGHSQGSAHGTRLLRERIAGTALQDRMVAAYLIGFSVEKDQVGGIPTCTSATDTGCVVGWNSVDGVAAGLFPDADNLICTNPLTWTDEGGYASHDLNLGGIGYPTYGRPADGEDVTAMIPEPGAADAECSNGNLLVPELRSTAFPSRMPGGSMHIYDYSLFYLNVRNNVIDRTRAFLENS